jgi:hypothetical protein
MSRSRDVFRTSRSRLVSWHERLGLVSISPCNVSSFTSLAQPKNGVRYDLYLFKIVCLYYMLERNKQLPAVCVTTAYTYIAYMSISQASMQQVAVSVEENQGFHAGQGTGGYVRASAIADVFSGQNDLSLHGSVDTVWRILTNSFEQSVFILFQRDK